MGVLRQDKVVFYHPLDDRTERTLGEDWTGEDSYAAGKVGGALKAVSGPPAGFGVEAEFLAGTASYMSVAALDSARFVVAYRDDSDSGHGTARVGSVSGTAITFGAEAEFLSAGGAYYASVAALGSARFAVAYRDESDSGHGTARIGSVSGTAISFGAEAEFLSAGGVGIISSAALDSGRFAVAYRDTTDSGHGTAKVGTVSGTDITFGAESEFSGNAERISAAALDSTRFAVAYRDDSDSGHGTARVGSVSGTAIVFGAEAEFLGAGVADVSAAALDSGRFVVAYRDASDSNHGTVKIGSVSGTDITFGVESEFLAVNGAYDISAAALDSGRFVVAYRDASDSNHGAAKIGAVSGMSVSFGAETEFLSANGAYYVSAAALSASRFVVAHQDNSDWYHGTARAWHDGSSASALTGDSVSYPAAAGGAKVAFCGWFRKPSA